MPAITVYKCDMCGRLWKDGKNDKAVTIELIVSPHNTKRFKPGKQIQGMFCGPRCCELALAATVLNFKPKMRKEGEEPRRLMSAFEAFLDNRPLFDTRSNSDDEDDEDDED